jgi:sugar phosphate isomerase/epimerase
MTAAPPGPADRLGIFARTFVRDSAAAVADAVVAAGYSTVQLNLSCIGLPTIPADPDALDLAGIAAEFARRGVGIWGVSATYNTIHPDPRLREELTARAARFLARVPELGAGFATLCTGTRDATEMWRRHPDNDTPAAWRDLRATLDELLPAAAEAGIRLGVEPEGANVVADAALAARLLAELGPDAGLVGIVLDPANLVPADRIADQGGILTAAVDRLGPAVVCLHAKDVTADGGYAAAGDGLLDYDLILALRAGLPAPVPVVVQDVTEADAARVRAALAAGLARHPWQPG